MKQRRWFIFGGIVLLAVVGVMVLAAPAPVATGSPLRQGNGSPPPQVVDSDPVPGEELPLDGAITLYFNQSMDMASVQAAFAITPEVEGRFEVVDDSTLRFIPAVPLARAKEYLVTVGVEAISTGGVPFAEPFTLRVTTVGYLEVSEVLPVPDASYIATDSAITVIFNRPVVPLVSIEEMANLPSPLVITPEVAGAGEWLNTSIYIFRPERLAGGTTYTVTVPAGLTDITGGMLVEDYTWSFSTLPPAVVRVWPAQNATDIGLDATVRIEFNQPMDRASVEEAFQLVEQSAGRAAGEFIWNASSTQVRYRPAERLRLNGFYTVFLDADIARAANGTAQLEDDLGWNFITVGPPAITGTYPSNGEEDVDPFSGFTIYFATPMDGDTIRDKITIDPTPEGDFDAYYYDYDGRYAIYFAFEPETTYTFTIAPGMADPYGNTIDQGMTVTFTTRSYDPDVALIAPGQVGIYSAYAPQTRLFARHLNVDQLNLALYQVPLPTLAALVGPDSWDLWDTWLPPQGASLLRRWSVPVEGEPNRWQYELLKISPVGDSGITACEGAPEMRLELGATAVVITDPDPLRARSEPGGGEIRELLYRDYQLPVVGGPVCANSMFWWQVTLRDGRMAWVAEGSAEEYYLDVYAPAQATALPPVAAAGMMGGEESLPPGAYYLEMNSPQTSTDRPSRSVMIVATANLTLKLSIDSALVWVTDMDSGLPLEGVPVTLYDEGFSRIASGVTGADGLYTAAIPRLTDLYRYVYAVVDSPNAFGFTVNQWSYGIESYDFSQNANYYPEEVSAYLYTDRPLYRPGQPVYYRGIVRARDDVTYTLPPYRSVPLRIEDPNGQIVYEGDAALNEYGTFSGQFDLDADAALGYYRLFVDLDESDDYYSPYQVIFGVAEYRAPEFQVTTTPEAGAVVQGDTVRVLVESSYFFGGPVSNADLSYSVLSQDYYFDYTGQQRYSFIDYNYDYGPGEYYRPYGEVITEGQGTTDAQGRFLIELPADLGERTQSQTYTIEARVVDESNQEVAGRTQVVVHQGEVYVGVRPNRYVGLTGEEQTINLIAVDWDSQGVAGQEIGVRVVERRWSNVQEEDEHGRTTWTWEVEEIPVEGAEGMVTTGEDGTATFAFTPPAAGSYKIYATTRDNRGNEIFSSAFLWVSGREYVSWRQQNSNRIDLITDRDGYQVGDTAEILIASPFQGEATALITIERGDVLFHDVITLESNSQTYTFPIEDAYAPNVFVTVLIVKGVDENNPVAAFRMGMAQIAVDPERREITVTVTPDRAQAGPGDTVTYTIETTDYAGQPVQAEVGVSVTDLAVLSIADPNSGPLMSHFYGRQGLGVRTAMPLVISADQLTQTTLDTIKGGGGGGGEGGIFDIRQEFVDTPYWNPTVVTDENGQATIEVTLPDNLTTWRLDARAVSDASTGTTLVGQTTTDLISTKPLLLRPVTPRFFVVGDAVTLAAIVNNNTGETMSVQVSLQASGVTFNSPQEITVDIPSGQRHRFEWMVTVENVQNVDLTFFASGNDGAYTDASKPVLGQGDDRLLPVYRYEVPETVGTGGMIDSPGTRTEAIALPERFEVTQGELTVRVDPSLAATAIDGLDWLANYPHQCIEQTVSRFLPNIMTYRALESLGVANPQLRINLEQAVSYALQRLYAEQKADGGWGWFITDPSNELTTAYALIGLVEARNSGFTVSDAVIERAANFILSRLVVPGISTETWRLNRQAFLLYALARTDRPNIAQTTLLFDYYPRMSLYAQAYLAVAFNRLSVRQEDQIETLVNNLVSNAVLSATGAHWEESWRDYWNWNTDTRTTAIVLGALIELDPENDLLAQAVRWLMVARSADAWETTQETAWAVMALTDWMVTTGELQPDYRMIAELNGSTLLDQQATPDNVRESYALRVEVADLLTDQANLLALTHGEGPGVMYYTAHLRAFLPVPEVEAVSRGIIIDRRYSLANDPDRRPIDTAPVGTEVRVTLTIIAPHNLHYVVIEDPIPAGTDAVDPNLRTTSVVGTQPEELNLSNPLSRGWGWWYFSNTEFRDEKVVIYATYLPRGTYEYSYIIRTGLPGAYNVIPTTGQEFYFPEVYGRSDGILFTITPEE